MAEHAVAASRSPVDPDERSRVLSRCYLLLLSLAANKRVADQDAAGNQTRSAKDIPGRFNRRVTR